MSDFNQFIDCVRQVVEGLEVEVDETGGAAPSTFAVLRGNDHVVLVEWRPGEGFGLSAGGEPGYGEGPEEILAGAAAAAARVTELLGLRARTVPPRHVLLRELRAIAGLSQERLASRLGVQQAAVSKLERREDITLSSLNEYVHALGGSLEIRANFGGEEFVITPASRAS